MIRSRRKLPLFTLLLLAISVGAAIYLPTSMLLDIQDKLAENTIAREKRMVQYFKISHALYKAGADTDLTALLTETIQQADISYFAVYKDGDLSYVVPKNNPLAAAYSYEQRAPKAGKDLIDELRSERSEFLSENVLLTMGIDKRYGEVIRQMVFGSNAWKVVLQDILMVIAMAAFAFWLHTRDLAKLKKEIAKHGRLPDALNQTKTLSAESEAIVAGLQGYAKAEKKLQEQADKLSAQVLPALQRELFSGLIPPYTFECTLVRTDINGFSQIFNSPYRDRFAKHIDDFFIGLTEIVSRYDGLIYEFVGDEAIFYFKDYTEADFHHDDQLGPSTSLNRAIDAIRDIHMLASDIGIRTQLEGHRFTVKSALAHGTLRFGAQVDGFSLSGGVLIETVRILSTVTDKADNHLYFGSRHTPYLRDDLITERVGVFSLKGYSEEVSLVRWVSSTPLSTHIANVTSLAHGTHAFDFVSQHRSDFSLETIIGAASSARDGWELKHHLSLVHALRSIKVYKAHHSLVDTLTDWLTAARSLTEQTPEWNRLVSSILMIFPNLVPKNSFSEKSLKQIEVLLDSQDARTVANTIDMLTKYGVEQKVRPLRSLFASENNRVAANAVIHEGTRELTKEILNKLDAMIFSRASDDARKSSGLYALGEIVRILRSRDAVYYSTRVDLHRLVERTESFLNHKNASVAEQASRVIAKADASAGRQSAA